MKLPFTANEVTGLTPKFHNMESRKNRLSATLSHQDKLSCEFRITDKSVIGKRFIKLHL
jgi:hypothetical protein